MLQLSKHQKKELARFERVCRNERRHAETHKPRSEPPAETPASDYFEKLDTTTWTGL